MGSAKFHIKRVVHNAHLTYEEFYTYLVQIECILNSRPICPLFEDLEDLSVLTPGHFLIGTALNSLSESQDENIRSTFVSRYKHLRFLVKQFWSKWSTAYLHHLQQRTKWQYSDTPEDLIGSLVLLHEDNVAPMFWKTGRVITIHPGNDRRVRVISIKTMSGVLKRRIIKISVRPVDRTDS